MNAIQLLTFTTLLATFNLLVMEETLENPLLWNNVHISFGKVLHRRSLKLPDKTITKITRVNASDNKTNYYNFYSTLSKKQSKLTNRIINNYVNTTKVFRVNLDDMSTDSIINSIYTTMEKPFEIKKTVRNRSISGTNLRKSMQTGFNKGRILKNCDNNCDNTWNPVQRNYKNRIELIKNVNQYIFTKSFETFTKAPVITKLTTKRSNKQNTSVVNDTINKNSWWNIFNIYRMPNKVECNNSIQYRNQSCSTNNNNKEIIRNKKSVRYDYSKYGHRFRKNNFFDPRNRKKYFYNNYRQIDHYNNQADWSHRQSDDDNAYYNQMPDNDNQDVAQNNDDDDDNDDDGQYDSNKMNRPNKNYQFPQNDQYSDNNVMTVDDKDPQMDDDGYKLHPNSHDDDAYNKWYYNQHDVSKYEDKRAISRLQDMYYCTKYCHCCKKGNKRITLKYNEYGPLGKILSIMKYFGYDTGYNFFYGRSADHSHNPLAYFKDYYKRFYGPLPNEEFMDDESFVFFNKDKDEPEGVSDCKEVCSCCEDNKKEKLKKKFDEMKRKEAKRKRKLKGLTGIIRYLLFSDDEGYYDFVDDDYKTGGRSYSGYHYHDIKNRRVVAYEPQSYDSNRDMGTPMYDSQDEQYESHGMKHEQYLDDSDHEKPTHDMEQHDDHDNDVEEHDRPKLILFDCSKCCRFCKKPEKKPTRRRRRRRRKKEKKEKKGLLDFLQGLLTGEVPDNDDDDGDGGGDDGGDDGGGDGGGDIEIGDVSFSASGGENTFDFEPSISLPSGDSPMTSPGSNSTSTPCCFNSTSMNSLIVVVTVAIIVIQAFSSVNVIGIVIVPLIFIGLIIIFIFLLLQAIIPVYFIPIFIIVLIIVLIPIVLLVILFFLLIPLFLFPIFFPFILKLPGIIPIGNHTSLNYTSGIRSSINCTIGSSTTSTTPMLTDNTTEAIGYFNDIELETTTYVSVVDFESVVDPDTISLVDEERQFKIPNSLYWKINAVLGTDHCLERAGCHLAIYTHSIPSYNNFIIRILENLSLSINETKFTAYKDAYQIGSINITNHKKCSTLYYCKPLKKNK